MPKLKIMRTKRLDKIEEWIIARRLQYQREQRSKKIDEILNK
jgi:hypothetical protein